MCGITGFAEKNHQASEARAIVQKMADLIAYRGPDGEGYFVDDRVALGHRRLSIIDLEGGRQPMFNEDGSLVVVFNGEIYNFQALREELKAAGHTFATHSDTEVLLHGYEQWGKDLPARLRGMFTFAIWDQKTGTLFGARDIFGIKPLYYYNVDGLFLFGSEIKCFLAHPGFRKELNEQRLPEYLSIEYIPNEETMFKNVFKLPGAHMFTWRGGELSIERYYDIRYHIDETKTLEEWEQKITETFAGSVAAHQIADVEVGCFLSSGVDSSFVVNEVAKGTPHVKSFSVGYAEEKYSELPYAQAFSKEIGVPSIANKVDADQFFEANRVIQWYLDEPMPNHAALDCYFLAQNARKYVKVVLSGEGADELFGGYPMYCQAVHFENYSRKVPAAVRRVFVPHGGKGPGVQGQTLPGPRRQGALAAVHARQLCVRDPGRPRPVPEKRLPQPRAGDLLQAVFRQGRGPGRTHPAAVGRHAHLDAVRHPAQSRPHEHGELPGAARALPGPRNARAGAVHPAALPLRRGAHQDRPARRGAAPAARKRGQAAQARLPRAAQRLAAPGQILCDGARKV